MKMFLTQHLRPAFVMTAALCFITGILYPGLITGAAQLLFPAQANGSLIERDGRVIGSALIGQRFTTPGYFHGRPSTAGVEGYDAMASGGSNKGPTDSTLAARIAERVDSAVVSGAVRGGIPADLVTASGSGLDPDISPASATLQIARVAQARELPAAVVTTLVAQHTTPRQLSVLGEPRVNVLRLNLALDSLSATIPSTRSTR
ncbi:MAG TPA: potassium-transporting ATPase subunit KdpC [Gemmatimonas sp.]